MDSTKKTISKIIITVASLILFMMVLPWLAIKFADGWAVTGLWMFAFFMYVTKDGYLWTNAFNYQYLFNIGEDAAGKIIKYAKENSVEAEYEPYQNTVAGKVVEITEEYIILDDTVICNDPADGTTYKILLNDLRIKRHVEHKNVKAGGMVQIAFEGEIDSQNTIDTAISATHIMISKGEVLIPE